MGAGIIPPSPTTSNRQCFSRALVKTSFISFDIRVFISYSPFCPDSNFKNKQITPQNRQKENIRGLKMNVTDGIHRLSKKEISTLYLICRGMTNEQIAETMHVAAKTIGTRITRINEKLNTEGENQNKRLNLQSEYCPAVRELTLDDLKNWIPQEPPPDIREKFKIIEKKFPEPKESNEKPPEKWNYLPGGEPPSSPSGKQIILISEEELKKRECRIFIIFGLVTIILIGIIIFLLRRTPPEIPLNQASSTPENTKIAALPPENALNTSPQNTAVPIISTPTISLSPTNSQTLTNTPTIEPTQTATVTITPIPSPVVLFSDDFENGLSPFWVLLSGKVYVTNGQLTADAPAWLAVGDPTWKNIKIEYNAYLSPNADCYSDAFPGGQYTVMLGFRFQDPDNMFALKSGQCGFMWFVVHDGKWDRAAGQAGPGPGENNWSKITVIVEGNKYTAYENDNKSTSFVDTTYQNGKVALRINRDTLIDNFVVSALP
jgi:DNA-binding CsgD family transcriptional regulator